MTDVVPPQDASAGHSEPEQPTNSKSLTIVRLGAKSFILEYCAKLANGQPVSADKLILNIENLYHNPDLYGLPIDIVAYRAEGSGLAVERHEAKNSAANPTIDQLLSTLVNQIEWSVQVPGAVDIDREKENKAKADFKAHLRTTILSALPEEEDLSTGLPNEADGFNQGVQACRDTISKLLGDNT